MDAFEKLRAILWLRGRSSGIALLRQGGLYKPIDLFPAPLGAMASDKTHSIREFGTWKPKYFSNGRRNEGLEMVVLPPQPAQ